MNPRIMRKIKELYKLVSFVFLTVFGLATLIFYLFIIPYLFASKVFPTNILFILVGIMVYGSLLILTAELSIATFGELYDLKRKTIIFSPVYRDGTPKPEAQKPSIRMLFFLILLSYFFIIHFYAITYLFIGNYIYDSFEKDSISYIDSFFLSFTALSVGPSGIQPASTLAKIIVMTEVLVGLIYTVLVFSLATSLLLKKVVK